MSLDAKGHGSETRAIPKARNTVYFGELCNAPYPSLWFGNVNITLTFPSGSVPQMGNLKEIRI
jgi:hypothetical protein